MIRLLAFSLLVVLFSFQTQAQPSQEDREKFKAAFEACLTEVGATRPEPGVRPSDEERSKMDACLSSKGISKPERPQGGGRGGPRGPRPEEAASEE